MKLVGLTGGIGMGKSTAAQWLAQHSVRVVDTDIIAREVVAPGQSALTDIRREFGPEYFHPDGSLHRENLAKAIFGNDQKRRQLEAILHPRIRETWMSRVENWRQENPRGIVAVVIPLLFETKARDLFDTVVCVACTRPTQLERLESRGWPREQILQRIGAQLPIEDKMAASEIVVWTEGRVEVLEDQLRHLLVRWHYA